MGFFSMLKNIEFKPTYCGIQFFFFFSAYAVGTVSLRDFPFGTKTRETKPKTICTEMSSEPPLEALFCVTHNRINERECTFGISLSRGHPSVWTSAAVLGGESGSQDRGAAPGVFTGYNSSACCVSPGCCVAKT